MSTIQGATMQPNRARLEQLHNEQAELIRRAKAAPMLAKAGYIEKATDLQAEINRLHTALIFAGGDDVSDQV